MTPTGLHITLNGHTYALDQLLVSPPPTLDDTGRAVIAFCRQWLTGTAEFIQPTSGSTGEPKAVRLLRSQMQHSARLTAKALRLARGMTALTCIDTRYIGGQMMLVRCLEVGMHLVVVAPSGTPLRDINEPIDLAAMVPYQVQTTLQSEHAQRINLISTLLIGGGALHPETEAHLQQCTVDTYATYGMTETVSHIALRKVNGEGRTDVFTALPETYLAQDERGCLIVEGPAVTGGRLVTNDVVEMISPTQFRWLGRADFVINTGGVKVFPEKVERQIAPLMQQHAPGRSFFVHGYTHDIWGQQVTLVVEGVALPRDTEVLLENSFRGCLTRFEIPRAFKYAVNFVEAANAKINRPATAALASPSPLSN